MIKYNLIFLLIIVNFVCRSQEKKTFISELTPPSSPAITILGLQPNIISRPKSWSALQTNILNNIEGKNNSFIPKNIALEFSPFFAKSNKLISNEEFLTPSIAQSLIHNFSISIGSAENFIIPDSIGENSAIALGIRTMIWEGTKSEKAKLLKTLNELNIISSIGTNLFALADDIECDPCSKNEFIEDLASQIKVESKQFTKLGIKENEVEIFVDILSAKLHEFLQTFETDINPKEEYLDILDNDFGDTFLNLDNLLLSLEELQANRKGFKLEIAFAMAIDFPTNNFEFSMIPKYGFWLTPSYQPFDSEWFEILGVIRYMGHNYNHYKQFLNEENELFSFTNSFDYGIKTDFKFNKLKASLELSGRRLKRNLSMTTNEDNTTTTISKKNNDIQYIGTLSYNLTNNVVLTYNFGKQFDTPITTENNLVSLFGLNIGFGTPSQKNLDLKK